ncbi:hypothetical protein J2Z33_003664 [Rubellimicrobium aerolatum]|nr:hypothetical protein [Rubellimicrobium aerolatum]
MPGRHVTDRQMRLFMKHRPNTPIPVAAARAGFSAATGHRIAQGPRPPSERHAPRERRRPDPLAAVFEAEVVPMLEASPSLRPVAVFEELMRRHPELAIGVRRTLERRIRQWRALHGPEREVIFRQSHEPGRMGLSDFTDMAGAGVTVTGVPLPHRLYHVRLAFSGFEHAHVVLGGESFVRWPRDCRTRSGPSAACRASTAATACRPPSATGPPRWSRTGPPATTPFAPTTAWRPAATIAGSPMRAARSRRPTVTSSARSRTRCASRGSRDFATIAAWRRFVDELIGRRNARNRKLIDAERAVLRPLPARRVEDGEETMVTVTSSGGFMLRRVFYTVPSRLIGHRLRVRLHDDRLDVFLGGTPLMTLPRGRGYGDRRRAHVVDYRHVIHALRARFAPASAALPQVTVTLTPLSAYDALTAVVAEGDAA